MGIMRDEDQRFVNLEKKLGVFVLLAAAGVLLLVVFVGLQQDMFISRVKLYLVSDSGKDLSEGMAVKLNGVKIGKVKRLNLDDITEVKLELSIYRDYVKWIKSDSYAMLVKEGLIGDGIIEIIPGSDGARPVEEGESLALDRERGLSEMAQEVRGEIKVLLNDIKETIRYINDPGGDIRAAIKNARRLSEDVLVTRDKFDSRLGATMTKVDGALDLTAASIEELKGVMGDIEALLGSTKETMERVGRTVKKTEEDYPDVLSSINQSLENVEKITEDLRMVTERTAPKIPDVVNKGSDLMDGTKDIIESAKKTWPISSNIESPREEMLRVDSYE